MEENNDREEAKIFYIKMEDGIPMEKLKSFCEFSGDDINDYLGDDNNYLVPGVLILSILPDMVKKIHKENPELPLENIKSIDEFSIKVTNLYINEGLNFKLENKHKIKNGFLFSLNVYKFKNKDELAVFGFFTLNLKEEENPATD